MAVACILSGCAFDPLESLCVNQDNLAEYQPAQAVATISRAHVTGLDDVYYVSPTVKAEAGDTLNCFSERNIRRSRFGDNMTSFTFTNIVRNNVGANSWSVCMAHRGQHVRYQIGRGSIKSDATTG